MGHSKSWRIKSYFFAAFMNNNISSKRQICWLFQLTIIWSAIIWCFSQVLEHQLKKVNAVMRDDERMSSNLVMKVTFGEPRLFLPSLPQNSLIHNLSIWCCRKKVSMSSLSHIVEQDNGQDALPVLWKFLQRVRYLSTRVNLINWTSDFFNIMLLSRFVCCDNIVWENVY